jgi:Transposase zinc-binding domain
MMPPPSGDWSVFQQIFADHWDAFAHAHPRYQTLYYKGLVAKMLACGNPEQMGYVEYRCLRCGQGTHRVAGVLKVGELRPQRAIQTTR